ncbi:CFI-box-CTERM domain-containing protein [Pseudoalteromonas sp. meg-B1]|uniref:CFI-box-CTERM domain-containing protein n=1 Tax=Pseudoalteromonas sp. meg-B1 TaxID=2203192 RepID=UPI000D6F2C22|nr:CFI-box-CTERM domain-containing protein [Pseudoalteromonas sp. meg-B1]PWS54315.1 hypothetical protein DK924_12860 [Pseudoalteromonas sp. meg-B1]
MSWTEQKRCIRCDGAGEHETSEAYGVKCSKCNGSGAVIVTYEPTNEECSNCKGTGKVKQLKDGLLYKKPPLFARTEKAVREYNEYYEKNSFIADCEYCKRTGKEHVPTTEKPKSEGCFLTTACVKHLGLGDDCLELSTLRDYRDNFILSLSNGKELLEEYYQYSPVIVSKINESNDTEKTYQYIYIEIKVAVKLIQTSNYHQALLTYKAMYKHLCLLFLTKRL